MHWTTLTLQELRASTKAQIVRNVGEYIAAHFTKRQVIRWLVLGDTESGNVPDRTVVTHDDQGRVVKMVKVWRAPETGDRLSGRVMTWQYFATREIRFIFISDRDGDNVEIRRRRIRHFRDGRQPVMEDITP